MNPLNELRGMVTTAPFIETGVVTAIGRATINVRTRGGLKSFSIPNTEAYKAGDTVRFQGNVLLGRTTSTDNLPTFSV